MSIIRSHFRDEIAKNFMVEFEANVFSPDLENIWRQRKDGQYIVELYYKTGEDTREYICDLFSWESRVMTAERMMTHIGIKWSDGKIGSDWVTKGGLIGISQDVIHKHEAALSDSDRDTDTPGRIHARGEGVGKADR